MAKIYLKRKKRNYRDAVKEQLRNVIWKYLPNFY